MTAWFERTGIILFTERFEAAIAFYREVLGLPVEEEQADLVRFGFGGAYLMVERGGAGRPEGKSRAENPVTLRFNVADFDRAVKRLAEKGVAADIRHWDWGTTAHFLDPDGTRIEVRDPFHN
jgi:lactoylglutathione lyase